MKQNYLAILALLFYVIFARDISHAIFNEKQSLYSNLWLSPIRIHYRLPLCLHGYKIQSFEIDRTSLHSSLSLSWQLLVATKHQISFHRRSIITTIRRTIANWQRAWKESGEKYFSIFVRRRLRLHVKRYIYPRNVDNIVIDEYEL